MLDLAPMGRREPDIRGTNVHRQEQEKAMELLFNACRIFQRRYPALVLTLLMVSSIAVGQAATYRDDPYSPRRFGIPDIISGYPVLAVMAESNSQCTMPGERRLILQSPEKSIDKGLRKFKKADFERELHTLNLAQASEWELSIVGPGTTREQVINQLKQASHFFKAYGCHALQQPPPGCQSIGGECKQNPSLHPTSFTIIQNTDIHLITDIHAQSVILVAPTVGSNQKGIWSDRVGEAATKVPGAGPERPVKCSAPIPIVSCTHHPGFSAFLNNGITDGGYFLQVGLFFANPAQVDQNGLATPQECLDLRGCSGNGLVVWAASPTGENISASLTGHVNFAPSTSTQSATVPYFPGHQYYTTITYTSGTWWTCAADLANPNTYQCINHPDADATHSTRLREDPFGTNIFIEHYNENRDWAAGFSSPWIAQQARIYSESQPQPLQWQTEAKWVLDSCSDSWPAAGAVRGTLRGDGSAYFQLDNIPPFCL